MGLKTNSKKAMLNLQEYIVEHCDGTNHGIETPETFAECAAFIYNAFRTEKYHLIEDYRYYHNNEQLAFIDWCSGLPSALDTCYYYNRSAVQDLGAILEQSEKEKERFTESDAELLLTQLIYREIKRGVKK